MFHGDRVNCNLEGILHQKSRHNSWVILVLTQSLTAVYVSCVNSTNRLLFVDHAKAISRFFRCVLTHARTYVIPVEFMRVSIFRNGTLLCNRVGIDHKLIGNGEPASPVAVHYGIRDVLQCSATISRKTCENCSDVVQNTESVGTQLSVLGAARLNILQSSNFGHATCFTDCCTTGGTRLCVCVCVCVCGHDPFPKATVEDSFYECCFSGDEFQHKRTFGDFSCDRVCLQIMSL